MVISEEYLEQVKWYCKIDVNDDDDLLRRFIIPSVQEQICMAIEEGTTPETFNNYPKFDLAVMKQVKEEYDHRGLSTVSNRYPLANGVLNIIHQLRVRETGE